MKKLVFALAVVMVSAIGLASSASAAPAQASVRVGHGIPGGDLGLAPALPVDVLVDDSICLLKGFEFGHFAGPVMLNPGTHNIKISLANIGTPCGNSPVIQADVPFTAGEDATVLAHLDENGAPTASKFVNNVSRPGFLKARVQAHHTAAAPTVDLDVVRPWNFGNRINLDNISNGDSAAGTLFLGSYDVKISPASGDPIFTQRIWLKPGKLVQVYAVGSLSTGSFQLLINEVPTR
ncbi:MAG: DUF4397 domain-containing protein [Chloroflexota bacterium]